MELLRHGGSAVLELQTQLPEVLLDQRYPDVLRAEIARILRPGDLGDREEPARELLLEPQDIHLEVPDFVQAAALRDPDGGRSVHPDGDLGVAHAEVREQGRDT